MKSYQKNAGQGNCRVLALLILPKINFDKEFNWESQSETRDLGKEG